ncbi:MAG: MTH1187 family thiamine-binding protein [Cyclobacteriaceae bacterium]|nr:MTH1187 family thiamine-binding protein [Cyclobacteriaceae bacterium]
MDPIVNIAIQVIPIAKNKDLYQLVDKAIEVIQQSGVKYQVCPFETVMEGPYDQLMDIVKKAHEACLHAGADEVIVNLKIQRNATKEVHIEDKTEKYQSRSID